MLLLEILPEQSLQRKDSACVVTTHFLSVSIWMYNWLILSDSTKFLSG